MKGLGIILNVKSATKLYKVVENTERILAIELLNAAQALAFRNNRSSEFIENILDIYRSDIKFLNEDRLLYNDIEKSIYFLQSLDIDFNLL